MQRALVDTHRRAYDLIASLDPGALVTSDLAHTPPPMPPEDLRFVEQVLDKLDYLGVDYYYGLSLDDLTGTFSFLGHWVIRPQFDGLCEVLLMYSRRYPELPLYIVENGMATDNGKPRKKTPHPPLHAGRLHPGQRLLDPAGDRRWGRRDRLQLLEPRRQLRVGQLPGPLRPVPRRREERPDAPTQGDRRGRRLPRGHRRGRCARGVCADYASGVLLVREPPGHVHSRAPARQANLTRTPTTAPGAGLSGQGSRTRTAPFMARMASVSSTYVSSVIVTTPKLLFSPSPRPDAGWSIHWNQCAPTTNGLS